MCCWLAKKKPVRQPVCLFTFFCLHATFFAHSFGPSVCRTVCRCLPCCQHKHPNYQVFAQVSALIRPRPRLKLRLSRSLRLRLRPRPRHRHRDPMGTQFIWGHGSLGQSSDIRPTLHVLMLSSSLLLLSLYLLSTNYVCAHGQASPNDPKLPTMTRKREREEETEDRKRKTFAPLCFTHF